MMRNKKAFETHNQNQNRLAARRARALGPMRVNQGNTKKDVSSASTVIYCEACKCPVVDSKRTRTRHAQKSEACKTAMEARNV